MGSLTPFRIESKEDHEHMEGKLVLLCELVGSGMVWGTPYLRKGRSAGIFHCLIPLYPTIALRWQPVESEKLTL